MVRVLLMLLRSCPALWSSLTNLLCCLGPGAAAVGVRGKADAVWCRCYVCCIQWYGTYAMYVAGLIFENPLSVALAAGFFASVRLCCKCQLCSGLS